jgi:hypothetical protein
MKREVTLGFFLCAFIAGAFVAAIAMSHGMSLTEKYDCESQLPRNVECVWTAPTPATKESK